MLDLAKRYLDNLGTNRYPGQGIVVGLDDAGEHLVLVCWIMGRDENSRNRIFMRNPATGQVSAEAADPSKVKDPSFIIYSAMLEAPNCYAVGNGAQTGSIAILGTTSFGFSEAMRGWQYTPDSPNFTPRISAICRTDGPMRAEIAVLRKSRWSGTCDRHIYSFEELGRGLGLCVTTYKNDGDPLPAFEGDPYLLPLQGSCENIADTMWHTLDKNNKVSLAVKFINMKTRASQVTILNMYKKVKV